MNRWRCWPARGVLELLAEIRILIYVSCSPWSALDRKASIGNHPTGEGHLRRGSTRPCPETHRCCPCADALGGSTAVTVIHLDLAEGQLVEHHRPEWCRQDDCPPRLVHRPHAARSASTERRSPAFRREVGCEGHRVDVPARPCLRQSQRDGEVPHRARSTGRAPSSRQTAPIGTIASWIGAGGRRR